jgi:hypothetical protein
MSNLPFIVTLSVLLLILLLKGLWFISFRHGWRVISHMYVIEHRLSLLDYARLSKVRSLFYAIAHFWEVSPERLLYDVNPEGRKIMKWFVNGLDKRKNVNQNGPHNE